MKPPCPLCGNTGRLADDLPCRCQPLPLFAVGVYRPGQGWQLRRAPRIVPQEHALGLPFDTSDQTGLT